MHGDAAAWASTSLTLGLGKRFAFSFAYVPASSFRDAT